MPCPWFAASVEGRLIVVRPHTNTCAIIASRCIMDEDGQHPDYQFCVLEGCGRAREISAFTRMHRFNEPQPPTAA